MTVPVTVEGFVRAETARNPAALGLRAMATENDQQQSTEKKKRKKKSQGSGGSPIYALGMIGAWVYFFQQAEEPEDYALALLKGLFWPAFMVYEGFAALADWKANT